MNELDQFVKHDLRIEYYIRYTDDFAIVSESDAYLKNLLPETRRFLAEKLALEFHPKKICIPSFYQGIDFLGYIIFPKFRLLRTKTRQRIFKKMRERIRQYNAGSITKETLEQSLQSYLGALSHANAYRLGEELKNTVWFG